MAFLPQAFPPAAADGDCALYDSTRSAKSAAKKAMDSNSRPNAAGEWHRVESKR